MTRHRYGHYLIMKHINFRLNNQNGKTHGYSRTPTYHSWYSMKQRCLYKKAHDYHRYGGRGISICEKWLRFEGFLEDMGERPYGTTLDRVDTNGNYFKENCRWADLETQNNNRRNSLIYKIGSETMTFAQFVRKYSVVSLETAYSRVHLRKWSIEKALNTKARNNHRKP